MLAVPTIVGTGGTRIADVACGFSHIVAITTSGTLVTLGNNDKHQLGRANEEEDRGLAAFSPRELSSPVSMVSVACGFKHSVAVSAWGSTFSWGDNTEGQVKVES